MENNNVFIHPTAIIYPNVVLHDNTFIGPYCIIGEPTAGYYKDPNNYVFQTTEIGEGSVIRSNTIIYEGNKIGKNFQTGHHVTIREGITIGNNCSVGTLSDLQGKAKIGDFVRMHSNVHIGQGTEIDDFAWIYPYVVATNDKYPPLDTMEGCKIGKYAVVATGSILLPGVRIGDNSMVAAGAVVSKDVGEGRVVKGVPAKDICAIEDIKMNGETIYPWKDHMTENRGYPWQTSEDNNLKR